MQQLCTQPSASHPYSRPPQMSEVMDEGTVRSRAAVCSNPLAWVLMELTIQVGKEGKREERTSGAKLGLLSQSLKIQGIPATQH